MFVAQHIRSAISSATLDDAKSLESVEMLLRYRTIDTVESTWMEDESQIMKHLRNLTEVHATEYVRLLERLRKHTEPRMLERSSSIRELYHEFKTNQVKYGEQKAIWNLRLATTPAQLQHEMDDEDESTLKAALSAPVGIDQTPMFDTRISKRWAF
jgi:hypothetical protein